MAVNVCRPVLVVLGLFSLAGCVGFGPLEIEVDPGDLALTLPGIGTTHVAYFTSYKKLIDECGPGMESVKEAYERQMGDRDHNKILDPAVQEAIMKCLEEQPNLVPKECKRRMVLVRGAHHLVSRSGDGVVPLQCGESAILPLEVTIKPLDVAHETTSSPIRGTHVATYSYLEKLLDECGPGSKKARDIAFQSKPPDDEWDVFGNIVDSALVKCLAKLNLLPEACRHRMIPLHNSPVRSFEPKVHFYCGKAEPDALLH